MGSVFFHNGKIVGRAMVNTPLASSVVLQGRNFV